MRKLALTVVAAAAPFIFVAARAPAVTVQAEDLVQNPAAVVVGSHDSSNNKYEDYNGWGSLDTGSSLVVHTNETIVEADVPHLRITGLTANGLYDLTAFIAYANHNLSPNNILHPNFQLFYSFTSPAHAAGGSALALDTSNISTFVYGGISTFDMGQVAADGSGNIDIYLGNKRTGEGGPANFSGWDQFELTLVPEPASLGLLILGSMYLLLPGGLRR